MQFDRIFKRGIGMDKHLVDHGRRAVSRKRIAATRRTKERGTGTPVCRDIRIALHIHVHQRETHSVRRNHPRRIVIIFDRHDGRPVRSQYPNLFAVIAEFAEINPVIRRAGITRGERGGITHQHHIAAGRDLEPVREGKRNAFAVEGRQVKLGAPGIQKFNIFVGIIVHTVGGVNIERIVHDFCHAQVAAMAGDREMGRRGKPAPVCACQGPRDHIHRRVDHKRRRPGDSRGRRRAARQTGVAPVQCVIHRAGGSGRKDRSAGHHLSAGQV